MNEKPLYKEITANHKDSEKWKIHTKASKSTTLKQRPNYISHSHYQPLNSKSKITKTTDHNRSRLSNKYYQTENSSRSKIKNKSNKVKKPKLNSLVVNLSKRMTTDTERSVLELGLTFCPSQNNFNKEKLSLDFFHFIRRLKLHEQFHTNPPNASTDEPCTDERSKLKWKSKNSDWYPDEVKYNRTEGLLKFIESITTDLISNLKKNERNFWNNLNNDQRKALLHLSN